MHIKRKEERNNVLFVRMDIIGLGKLWRLGIFYAIMPMVGAGAGYIGI